MKLRIGVRLLAVLLLLLLSPTSQANELPIWHNYQLVDYLGVTVTDGTVISVGMEREAVEGILGEYDDKEEYQPPVAIYEEGSSGRNVSGSDWNINYGSLLLSARVSMKSEYEGITIVYDCSTIKSLYVDFETSVCSKYRVEPSRMFGFLEILIQAKKEDHERLSKEIADFAVPYCQKAYEEYKKHIKAIEIHVDSPAYISFNNAFVGKGIGNDYYDYSKDYYLTETGQYAQLDTKYGRKNNEDLRESGRLYSVSFWLDGDYIMSYDIIKKKPEKRLN